MTANNRIIKGSEIPATDLRLPRAIAIYNAAKRHRYCDVLFCKRNVYESEILIISLSRLGTPELPANPINDREEIAIICDKKDLDIPAVYALRKDFPTGLPHSNGKEYKHPVSLCVSDVPFSDYRLQFSAYDFIESIRSWFFKNSIGILHEENRPLEVLFAFQKVCYPIQKLNAGNPYSQLEKITNYTYTLDYVQPFHATHYLINILTSSEISQSFASMPKTIGDLIEYKDYSEKNLPQSILDNLSKTVAGNLNLPLLIMCITRQRRKENSKEEQIELFLIKVDQKICDIKSNYRKLKSQDFYSWFHNLPIEVIFLLPTSNIETNSSSNGMNTLFNKITLLGTGTLGANVLDYFVREGISREIVLVDYDLFYPHNIARHILNPDSLVQYKVLALQNQYSGIEDQKISAIVGNYLDLPQSKYNQAFTYSELIIDATTSVAASRKLAFESYFEGQRRCSIFLNPKGSDLVLLMEDKSHKQRLDLLEMSYLRSLINNPDMDQHLSIGEGIRTNNFSCRSESAILNYDNIGMLAAVASQQIKKISQIEESSLCIWRVNPDNSTIMLLPLKQQTWVLKRVGNIQVYIADDVSEKIENEKRKNGNKETGGCLFGCYDKDRNIIYIVYVISAPMDSKCSPSSFIRGYYGLKEFGEELNRKTYNQVRYLGEWHTHPNFANNPSETDKIQFQKMSDQLANEDLPFVQLISGDNGLYINVNI